MSIAFIAFWLGIPSANPLNGVWVSDCTPIGKGGRHGYVTRVEIRNARFRTTAQVYAAKDCASPTFRIDYRGVIVETRRVDSDRTTLDHRVQSITLTPQSGDIVAQYNRGDGCGLKGWRVNVAKSVLGQRCDPYSFPLSDTTLHDTVWMSKGALRFGAFPLLWTNDAPGKRPAQPLPVVYRAVRR